MKRNLLVLFLIIILFPLCSYGNSAYKALSEAGLYERTEKGKNKKICDIAKGDTIYVTDQTRAYLEEHEGDRLKYIPFEYKGQNGYVSLTWFYPIKLNPSDKLSYVQTESIANRNPVERFLVPQMEWAMNIYSGPTKWLYAVLAFTALTLILWVLYVKYERSSLLLALGLSLVAISLCEVVYVLSFFNLFIWFLKPSTSGGWGMTLLNFLLLVIVTGIQVGGLYFVWSKGLDNGKKDAPGWIKTLSLIPIILGIALIIIPFFDNGEISGSTYLYILCSLLIPALCGMGWLFINKEWVSGVVYPLIFILASLGLIFSIMTTGLMIFLIGIAVVLLILGLSAVWGGLNVAFANKEVTVITRDGKSVQGRTNIDGTVSGYDGKEYKVE